MRLYCTKKLQICSLCHILFTHFLTLSTVYQIMADDVIRGHDITHAQTIMGSGVVIIPLCVSVMLVLPIIHFKIRFRISLKWHKDHNKLEFESIPHS
jgi:hypothetical protein